MTGDTYEAEIKCKCGGTKFGVTRSVFEGEMSLIMECQCGRRVSHIPTGKGILTTHDHSKPLFPTISPEEV